MFFFLCSLILDARLAKFKSLEALNLSNSNIKNSLETHIKQFTLCFYVET